MIYADLGGSFNPAGTHHLEMARFGLEVVDRLIISPCGFRRDKPETNCTENRHRENMLALTFSGMSRAELDLYDLSCEGRFTPTHAIEERHGFRGELWHIIGADLLVGAAKGKSLIHRFWQQPEHVLQDLRLLIILRRGYKLSLDDLPPKRRVYELDIPGSSTEIRDRRQKRLSISRLVTRETGNYIREKDLYLAK